MKVAMILGASLGMLPWNYFYLDEFFKYDCEITVISWNREGIGNIGIDDRIILKEYNEKIDNSIPILKKVGSFLRFREYGVHILADEKFDLIVVSTIQIGLLFRSILQKQYKGRYIYDVRDPWFERKPIIHYLSNSLVKDAAIVFISSEAYRKWLPSDPKITVTHNVRFQDRNSYYRKPNNKEVIRICFWGITREIETNIRFINIIANDSRFQLEYYGVLLENARKIFDYCEKSEIKNVKYMGTYPKDGKMEIASTTDMIHNVYMSEKEPYDTRMFNKYYDGVVFEIPQIAYNGGYVGECIEKYGVGLSIELQPEDADRIYNYYMSLDPARFHLNCLSEQNRIKTEMKRASTRLDEVIEIIKGGANI